MVCHLVGLESDGLRILDEINVWKPNSKSWFTLQQPRFGVRATNTQDSV